MDYASKLQKVKSRTWFYEFDLPDGTRTRTNVPANVLPIHASRRDKLAQVIVARVERPETLTAADFASHEGYYTVELARHFRSVHGYEWRDTSIDAARLVTEVLGVTNVDYTQADLQTMPFDPAQVFDFVLLYGLIYHLEDPIHTLRLAGQMCRKHLLIETQILPYDILGRVEDGHHESMRAIEGVFGLTADYSHDREGGSTNMALVPSLNALLFLLRTFGFDSVEVLPSSAGDYEQFRRRQRVVIYARKT